MLAIWHPATQPIRILSENWGMSHLSSHSSQKSGANLSHQSNLVGPATRGRIRESRKHRMRSRMRITVLRDAGHGRASYPGGSITGQGKPEVVRKRAVIFDDEDAIRSLLWRFFDNREYEVFTFPYPDLCPLHVRSECPCPVGTSCSDIIISDVNMHGRNGIDFVEELMTKGCKHRHFALMSGAFTDADRARATHLGCTLFTKPLDMDALRVWVEVVEKSLRSERMLFNWAAV